MIKSTKDTNTGADTSVNSDNQGSCSPSTSSDCKTNEVKQADSCESASSPSEQKTILEQAEEVLEQCEAQVIEETEAEKAAGEKDAGGEEPEAAASVDAEALASALEEVAEWQGKYMRLHAEWDTYRRRMEDQRAAEKARACEKLVEELLPVIDDFERTIDYAEKNGEAGLLGGVQAVHSKFVNTLEKQGVVVIDPAGEAFDALEHQAVGTVADEEAFEETVAQVYQKGYKMGTKVIRSAMVTVTTGGPTRPKPETEEEK